MSNPLLLIGGGAVLLLGGSGPLLLSYEVAPIAIPAAGFDAGPSQTYGSWYNLAFNTHSNRNAKRRRRNTDLGRFVAAQAYQDEARAERERMAPDVAVRAAKIVDDAVSTLVDSRLADDAAAIARVAKQEAAYAALLHRTLDEARQAFIAAVVDRAVGDYRLEATEPRPRRLVRDDLDVLVMMEMVQ